MDNRINEIRRKVSLLRARMAELERLIRDQISHDLDCSEAALEQLAARREIVRLIGEWKAAGGGDRLPSPADRQRMGKGKLARLGLKPAVKSGLKSASKSDLSMLSAGPRNLTECGRRSVA